jgi:two-component system sensor kinase FixL
MYRCGQLRDRMAAFGAAAILLLGLAVLGWPNGWKSALCLIPLVAVCFLDVWFVAGAGAIALFLSKLFASVPWVPKPEIILLLISVVSLIEWQRQCRIVAMKNAALETDRSAQAEWQAFFDNSPAAILTTDERGRVIMANPAAHKLLGFEDRSLKGEYLEPYVPVLVSALRIRRENQLVHTTTECKGWRPNCAMFMADAWFSISQTSSGIRLGAVLVDATERLQEREGRAMRSSLASSEIALGAVLHEIRNLSAAAALMHTNMEGLQNLKENADFQAIGNIVKTLTRIASAELRASETRNTSVNLLPLFDQLRIIIEPSFSESSISVHWEIAPNLPDVWGEEPGLMQIFMNLAQNANKAMSTSEKKQLTISASVKGNNVIVRFQDTGPGVGFPEELFQPFQTGSGMKRLGLYLSRAIAHSMSGELRYEPAPNGSCFILELLPLHEWERVELEYGKSNIPHPPASPG